MESIMNTQKGVCYLCGMTVPTESHHCLHGTANRRIAEKEGLKVWLCRNCHTKVHRNKVWDTSLEQMAQRVWEDNFKKDYPYKNHADEAAREAFRRLFGKSYL